MTDVYVAARSTSVFVDRSDRGKLVILGADRASYLQGLLTNDIAALSPGEGCYAAYLTPQGRMAADMLVLDLGEGLLLDVHSSTTSWLADRLREFVFTEEVTVEDRTSMWSAVGVHGPGSATAVSTVVWSGEAAAPYAAGPKKKSKRLARQIANPVRFVDLVRGMAESGIHTFIEVGPGAVLSGLIGRTDAALYSAKHGRRNQVSEAEVLETPPASASTAV